MVAHAGVIAQQRRHAPAPSAPTKYQGKQKTDTNGGSAGWNSRLVAVETIPANTAGGFRFEVIDMAYIFALGLGDATDAGLFGDGGFTDRLAIWYRNSATECRTYTPNAGAIHPVVVGDVLEIKRTAAGVFSYLINDSAVTGTALTNTDELYLMLSFFHLDAVLDEIQIDQGAGYVGGTWDSTADLNEDYYEDYP